MININHLLTREYDVRTKSFVCTFIFYIFRNNQFNFFKIYFSIVECQVNKIANGRHPLINGFMNPIEVHEMKPMTWPKSALLSVEMRQQSRFSLCLYKQVSKPHI